MKKIISIALVLFMISQGIFSEDAKNALLIANGKYEHFASLSEPVKEAENLRVALEQIGFTVKIVKNASLEEMKDALFDFETILKKSKGTAFFHYGGHAVQVAGKNYLIPSTSDIPDERRVSTRAVNLDEVMECMAADTNIVILDSCRNNPLPAGSGRSASRGLVASSVKPKNSIIVYSAEAGCTARDGVFTPVLTKEIARKGLSLQAVLINVRREVQRLTDGEQTPGEYSQMTDIVYLAGKDELKKNIEVSSATGVLKISSDIAGDVYIDGIKSGSLREFGTLLLSSLPSGMYKVELRGTHEVSQNVLVKENETTQVNFLPKTKHVTAEATEKGIVFTIKRPNEKAYLSGFQTVTIFKLGKKGEEIARAVVIEGGTQTSKKELTCLFPLCEDGEECNFLVDIQPQGGNIDKSSVYKESLSVKAKGGIKFASDNKQGNVKATFSLSGNPNISIEESEFWRNQARTIQIIFFAGNGDFETSGATLWFYTHTQKLSSGESFSFNPAFLASKFKATGKKEFFAEVFYRFNVPESSGIKYFIASKTVSNIAHME